MMATIEARALPDPVQELLARQAIEDAQLRYCRGVDRMDRRLVASAFNPGATVDFGPFFTGDAQAFTEWAWEIHAGADRTIHQCHGTLVELLGDGSAVSESHYTVVIRHRPEGGKVVDSISWNRYLDRWSRRAGGAWGIDHRQAIIDISTSIECTLPPEADGSAFGSRRDPLDPSYAYLGTGDLGVAGEPM